MHKNSNKQYNRAICVLFIDVWDWKMVFTIKTIENITQQEWLAIAVQMEHNKWRHKSIEWMIVGT